MLDLAELCHFWWHHTRPAWDGGNFKTPLGGMKGFPDYVLSRVGAVLVVELKTELGVLSLEQKEWRRRLEPTGLYRLWRPSDWPAIEAELREGLRSPQAQLELARP